MATFAYTLLEPSGQKRSGYIDAKSAELARQNIAANGGYVLELTEQSARAAAKTSSDGIKKKAGKPSKSDIALFTRRMADLATAGLPLDRVLAVVAEQSESQVLTDVAIAALEDVRGGSQVSQALAKFPKFFPDVFTSTLQAGEASGQFGDVAERLAEFLEKEVARRSQVVSAMIYPGVLTFTSLSVIVFLLTFVIPRMSDTFKELGDNLPANTKVLLATTDFLTNQWYIVLGAIVGLFFAYKAWAATESGSFQRDAIMFKLPIAGTIIQKATVSRFARVLGTLVFGGVAILDAIELAGIAAGNKVFRVSAKKVQSDVREGRGIAEAMRDTGAFPPVLTNMVAVGEETGDLPKMLGRVSNSLDFEVDNSLRRATSLVEPLILIVMGGFVGFVVLSVILPIFMAQDLVK